MTMNTILLIFPIQSSVEHVFVPLGHCVGENKQSNADSGIYPLSEWVFRFITYRHWHISTGRHWLPMSQTTLQANRSKYMGTCLDQKCESAITAVYQSEIIRLLHAFDKLLIHGNVAYKYDTTVYITGQTFRTHFKDDCSNKQSLQPFAGEGRADAS